MEHDPQSLTLCPLHLSCPWSKPYSGANLSVDAQKPIIW